MGKWEVYSSYVPRFIRRLSQEGNPPLAQSTTEAQEAAILFADISGFTALTERLAQEGPAGLEKLTNYLNNYFTELIDLVHEHGGDIVKFAGDAILALWFANEWDNDLDSATQAAAHCGLVIQNQHHHYQAAENISLSLRTSIGAGTLWMSHLGGVNGDWEILVSGDPIHQVIVADQLGKSGQVILSLKAWERVHTIASGNPLKGQEVVVLGEAKTRFQLPRTIAPAQKFQTGAVLQHYLPRAILARLSAGQAAWLAELRSVTTLFINLPQMNVNSVETLEQSQQVMEVLQTRLHQIEGSINKLSIDDKGVSLLAALGLPPLSHEDDPIRAVQVAIQIQQTLTHMQMDCAIGIASGKAFCGAVGSGSRREYTMIGNVVNRAARLMQAALHMERSVTEAQILCDQPTYKRAVATLQFDEFPPMPLKGFPHPVPVYRPSGVVQELAPKHTNLVGRTQEWRTIASRLRDLLETRQGSTVVLEGEPGIGKSHLLRHALRVLQDQELKTLYGEANAMEQNTPYLAWKPIIQQLLELQPEIEEPTTTRLKVTLALQGLPEYQGLEPLLNPVLPVAFSENAQSEQYMDQRRVNKRHEILLAIFQQEAQKAPLVVMLEDLHWFDTASWLLLEKVRQSVSPLLMIAATRPMLGSVPMEYNRLIKDPTTQQLKLEVMLPEETITLVCHRLGVPSLPKSVAQLIRERAQGNPFFSEEIAYALRDAGHLRIKNQSCTLAITPQALKALDFPDTVQGVITSRIDRLTPQQQFSLKVASVIGRIFSFSLMKDIYPIEEDKPYLHEVMQALEILNITPVEIPAPNLTYIFKHVITQEVVYDLMLYAQRQTLHRAVAEWYERTYIEEIATYFPLLAFHWSHATEKRSADSAGVAKVVYYFEKSGEMALSSGAFPDAVHFLKQAWEWYEALPDSQKTIETELRLLQSLGTATFTTSGYGDAKALEIFDRAWTLCQRLEDASRVFPILWGLWINYHFSARTEQSIELGEKMLFLAQKENNQEFLLQAHHALWTTLIQVPDYERSQWHLEQGQKLYRSEMHQSHCRLYGGHDPGMCCQRAQCLSKWSLGFPDQAVAAGEKAIELSQSHYYSRITALMALAFIYKQNGDVAQATKHAQAIRELAQKQGFPGFIAWAKIIEGWCQGQDSLEQGITTILQASNQLGYKDPGYMAMLVELYLDAQNFEEGLRLVEDLMEVVLSKNEHNYESELLRLQGELLWQQSQATDAWQANDNVSSDRSRFDHLKEIENIFKKSLEIAKNQKAKSLELRTAINLAQFLKQTNRSIEGKQLLKTTYDWFSEGFATRDLQQAQRLLKEF